MTQLPDQHVQDAQKLSGDGIIELFEVQPLTGGTIYFKNANTLTWLGNEYTGLPMKLEGVERTSDEKANRPTLTIGQVESLFTPFLYGGHLDGAFLKRHRVLQSDIDSDTNTKRTETWIISQVPNYSPDAIQFKLRQLSDGPSFVVPAKSFIPPEFPTVSF